MTPHLCTFPLCAAHLRLSPRQGRLQCRCSGTSSNLRKSLPQRGATRLDPLGPHHLSQAAVARELEPPPKKQDLLGGPLRGPPCFPSPLRMKRGADRMARTSSLNCLSCRNPFQTPHSLNCLPPSTEKPFFSLKSASSHPLPKIGSKFGGVSVQEGSRPVWAGP